MLPRVSRVEGQGADYLVFAGRDLISNELFRNGVWEAHMLSLARLFFQDQDAPLVLDIGANLGAFSIPIAKELQAIGGQVLAFEPQRIVYYQLCANIFINRLDNCVAMQQALGSERKIIDIPEVDYSINENIGAFSLQRNFREIHGIESAMKVQTHTVPMIRLDELDIHKSPCLIKIDVEGLEAEVLNGGRDFLRKHGYPPILFEAWNHAWFDQGREELMALMAELGYRVQRLAGIEYLAQHPQWQGSLVELVYEGDVLKVAVRVR
ncbi:FkbM family methyltransferase [Comamonas sp. Y33R10-2]|uniref:FkbM family methyltransferase n=1 Tax=Comamonas sp. Y33R10-2 TaxID=2853257 RepID=UPI001C5CC196|nr:FkbM family methyltransferase [Comamonas sp. Y33R10-2]QXZ10878.1 FkbM family methyltransferase [Comamonas sp. Y33R10-2]